MSVETDVLCIHVDEMMRPSRTFEELQQSDGSLVPGKSYWSAVGFTVQSQPSEVYGKHRVVDLYASQCELWRFYDVMIMLSPDTQKLKSFGPNLYKYIMTYSRAERRPLSHNSSVNV